MKTSIATALVVVGMAGVAHTSCPLGVTQSVNANDNGCRAEVVDINPGVLSSRLYQGNARMEVEWPQGTFGGDPNTDVRVTLSFQDTAAALASPCGYGFVKAVGVDGSSPILDETVKNTGNFSWIVANFDHEASATYFIHIFPVLDAATVCTEGNSVNFATTEPFWLEAQLVTWAWPLPEGVAIEPGKTHTIHIENVINHARRWYFALDLFASIDNFNTETADTHSWKCQMRNGNDEALRVYAAEQHPPWDLVAHPREILDIPNLLGFADEFEGWHNHTLGDNTINTSITYEWTLPADMTAYFKQNGAYYTKVRDGTTTPILLTDPDVTLQIQIRVVIHDSTDHVAGNCDCRISDVTDPMHCGTACTSDTDLNGNGIRDYNDNNNNGVADAGDTWIENRWWFFDTNGNDVQDAGEANAYFSPPIKFLSSLSPTMSPTLFPTANPTANPTLPPTRSPTVPPTANPTTNPTLPPTRNPTAPPSKNPTANPTLPPTQNPTGNPTMNPTASPTASPTWNPTANPTKTPTANPTVGPSTSGPTPGPSAAPATSLPTLVPSSPPATSSPTPAPSVAPATSGPTAVPSAYPTADPTVAPSAGPTRAPAADPTQVPTAFPSANPTGAPSLPPSPAPSAPPSTSPTEPPVTQSPSNRPTGFPTSAPISASPSQSLLSVPPSQSPSNELMADGSVTTTDDDAEAGFDWWIILVLLVLLLLCCLIGMLWKRQQTGAGNKDPTYGEAGGGNIGWERENPAYAGVGEMSLLADGKSRDGALGNLTYEETSFDKPRQPALENNTYVALGSQSRPRNGAVTNAVYDVVDPLANGWGGVYDKAVAAPDEEATYGDVLPYTGEGRDGAVANVTYETTVGSPPTEDDDNYTAVNAPDGKDEADDYLTLAGRSNTDESTYSAAAPRDDDESYLTTGPPAADDPTYLDASGVVQDLTGRGRSVGLVRDNLYGAAGVRQDPMYDEIKASLPETEYASTDQIRPQRTLTEENDPANIYMARRESEDPAPAPPFLSERKATVWSLSELNNATRETSDGATSLIGTSSLAIRRKGSQGAAVPNTLHLQIPGGSPEYTGAPVFTPTSPAGSRDFQEPMSPAGKSPTTQSALI